MGFLTKLNISTSCDFGSQMSQYASLISISKKNNMDVVFIKEYIERGWGFPLNQPFTQTPPILPISKISGLDILNIKLNPTQFPNEVLYNLESKNNYNIDGDLWSFRYFEDIKEEILEIFTFKDDIKNFCLNYISNLRQEKEVFVSIHFRRGDYLDISSLNLSLNYYKEAINTINRLLPNIKIKYLIFSNGMDWVKDNFKLDNCVYVEGLDRFKDMCLMSLCDHNIIANSSFSWWGAFLNINPDKKVICPYNYLNVPHLNTSFNGKYYPQEWVSINLI